MTINGVTCARRNDRSSTKIVRVCGSPWFALLNSSTGSTDPDKESTAAVRKPASKQLSHVQTTASAQQCKRINALGVRKADRDICSNPKK